MTILVLGHLVLDEIHSYQGEVYHSPGGILFSLATFDAVIHPDDRLFPVLPIGRDASEEWGDLLRRFPLIDARYCRYVEEDSTRVRLFHESASQYNTQLVRGLGPVPFTQISPLLPQADLVYVNMMTGHDIELESAAELRGEGRLVYIDLHMIAYRVHPDGRREPAATDHWQQWLAAGDVLQCNEREFAAMIPGDDEAERLRRVFDVSDPHCLLVTRGEQGADIYTAPDHHLHIPAWPPARIVDPTGCGDAFGSTFAYGLACGMELEPAAGNAARVASYVAGIPGSRGMEQLRATRAGDFR
ncbi:MAG: carbohydrate kinase family protein [Bacteroidetes bacterium]|nr:carbohydrate kinase family protein [Bacteroidota bacterium]